MENIKSLIGKTVQFNKLVRKEDIGFDEGMKAVIKSIEVYESNPRDGTTYDVFFDFSVFEEENKLLMKPEFYTCEDDNRTTWDKSPFYPKDKIQSYYIMEDDLADLGKRFFEIIETQKPRIETQKPDMLDLVLNECREEQKEYEEGGEGWRTIADLIERLSKLKS